MFAPFAILGLIATVLAIVAAIQIKHRQIDDALAAIGRLSVEALSITKSRTNSGTVDVLLDRTRGVDAAALAAHPAVAEAHRQLSAAVEATRILKIKIFDRDGRILYSPERSEIGSSTGNPAAIAAAIAGETTTAVYPPRTVQGYGGLRQAQSVVGAYTPFRGVSGAIDAVFEIYVDTSPERAEIESNLRRLDAVIAATMFALYAALLALAWRAVRAQARQRLALAEERARFADFSDIAAGWVWETDAENRLVFSSQGIRAIGIEPDARYGMVSQAWDQPTGVGRDGPPLSEIMGARRIFRDVYIRLDVPGGHAWIARSGRPIFGPGGEFHGYRGADRDVTEQVRTERELRAADATKSSLLEALDRARLGLELAVETAQVGWWEVDSATGARNWSPRARDIWGIGRDVSASQETYLAAIHPDDVTQAVNLTADNVGTVVRHYRVRHAGGEIRHVRQHTRAERNADGTVRRIMGTVIDVTDIENLRTAAERAKATLDGALDAMDEGFALFDAQERLVTCNRTYKRLRPGAAARAVPGAKFADILEAAIDDIHPREATEQRAALIAWRLAKFRDPDGPIEIVRADGTTIEVTETRSDAGYTVSIYRDVTQERRAAAELVRAKALAEQANYAKSRFLATMSHEIRTPMNGVLGTVELLAGTQLDGRQRGYVEAVERSASALLAILDDILDYSKLEAGDMKIEEIAYDPAAVLRQTVALLTPGAEKKRLALECAVEAGVPQTVAGDPTRVRQVLFNLIGNAVKFTERGGVAATLSRDGDSLVFAISDTGIGIAADALPRLFDRFSQADETISRRFGGTGLGLAIVRELAQAMGGDIAVVSELGKGSTFSMRLPVRAASARPTQSAEPAAARAPARPLDLLVAEDNEINRMVVRGFLERMGHSVAFVVDGREAIQHAREKRYDAILMDAQMPEIDGVEATRWIRVLPEPFGSVPIVALTANAMRGDREAYLAAGMNDYVAKPIKAEELARALERATGIAATNPAAPAAEARPTPEAGAKNLAALVADLRAGRATR
ncbi:MAG: ATP-binding protein [Magnetospirillum sp.]|nr:ATP-binding protein [Magnetospirillum sp.]